MQKQKRIKQQTNTRSLQSYGRTFQSFNATLRVFLLIGGLGVAMAGCAKSPVTIPDIKIPSVKLPLVDVDITSSLSGEVVDGDYITAYSRIALGLRQCWLAENKPLSNAQFFARNKADGSEKKSDIFVHGPAVHPKRGPRIFSIHLKPRSSRTEVRLDNRKLSAENETNVTKDVRRWIEGKEDCLDHKVSTGETAQNATIPEKTPQKTQSITLPKRKQ